MTSDVVCVLCSTTKMYTGVLPFESLYHVICLIHMFSWLNMLSLCQSRLWEAQTCSIFLCFRRRRRTPIPAGGPAWINCLFVPPLRPCPLLCFMINSNSLHITKAVGDIRLWESQACSNLLCFITNINCLYTTKAAGDFRMVDPHLTPTSFLFLPKSIFYLTEILCPYFWTLQSPKVVKYGM